MTSSILITRDQGEWHLKLNRPQKKNALNSDMYTALSDALEAAGRDDSARVIRLSAEGDDFCAGNDIADFVALAQHQGPLEETPVFRFLKALTFCPKPIVAAVQGQAVGIGTTMLLHCDLVYLETASRLSLPFLKLGLTPEGGSGLLLPARIGHVRAFEWLALGRPLTAPEALQRGLCNAVVERVDLEPTAQRAATQLSAMSLEAVVQTKALLRDPEAIWAQIVREGEIFRARLNSPEAAQAFAAFLKA